MTGPDIRFEADSFWRVRQIYERFIGLHVLPDRGVAIDIGAGFGAFAVPFAKAFPNWKVLAFEPDSDAFSALGDNIKSHRLKNLFAVNCAVGVCEEPKIADLAEALSSWNTEAIKCAAPGREFRRDNQKPWFVGSGTRVLPAENSTAAEFDTVPANYLPSFQANLLKFTAPGLEDTILREMVQPTLGFVVGESWNPPPSKLAYGRDARNLNAYIPVAGKPIRLSKVPDEPATRQGLDVVVAMYNAREWIEECVNGIVNNDADDVHAIVVDDGSTDGCGDYVREVFADNARVRVLSKPNGGCASARNFGRLDSDASYITFVDSDDVPEPALFPELLALARYAGTGVVQGGFDLLFEEPNGARYEDSAEVGMWNDRPRNSFGDLDFFTLGPEDLIAGQPSIWRRVYRRDFLDNHNLWFPEHIRAFDDQIFHMLSLYYSKTIFCTDQVNYHYRQHPKQDIKQGDERMFASLDMYRMVLKRAVVEGWPSFHAFASSFVNTVNWTAETVKPELTNRFLKGAAELWVNMKIVFGSGSFESLERERFANAEIHRFIAEHTAATSGFYHSYAWAYLDAAEMHPDLMRRMSETNA